MEFSEVVFISEMIEAERSENQRNLMIAAGYTAWHLGAGEGKTFQQFLSGCGLMPEIDSLTQGQKEVLIDRALSIADRIKKADKK
jgi:hypothetical protein